MCNHFMLYLFVFIGILCAIVHPGVGQSSTSEHAQCTNNKKLPPGNAIWMCTEESNCIYAKDLISKGPLVRCGSKNKKLCCPSRVTSKPLSTRPSNSASRLNFSKDEIKRANQIALDKCYEYGNYRFDNYTKEGPLLYEGTVQYSILKCQQVETLIVGGTIAAEREYSHMALLGYNEELDGTDTGAWRCAGSLISEQFVLSAAHCTTSSGNVKWAALGLLNRSQITQELLNKNIFRVIEHINHPGYKKDGKYEDHDIALYKLQRRVPLGLSIRPACLHTELVPIIPMKTGEGVSATGWGQTGTGLVESEELLKVTITFFDDKTCREQYKSDSKLQKGFDSTLMICAGHQTKSADTCVGDSGGPLQILIKNKPCMWSQVGVTSRGPKNCGQNTAGIYTRVSAYVPWIRSIVWPNS